MRVRPILSSLLASKLVSEEEKNAILNYLGGVETLDEDAIDSASDLADNKEAVVQALMDIMQKHDVKPLEEIPAQPVSEPQDSAMNDTTIKEILKETIGV